MSKKKKIIIIGAGPAGLAAAYEFVKQKKSADHNIEIFDMDSQVGGISKTLEFKGYRFDLGGHRFYTKIKEIDDFYKNFLGKDMLKRTRLSRIYYQKKFYDYPLSATNALGNLGMSESTSILISWLIRQFKRYQNEKTFEQWVANRFGDKLFKMFFKSYTEKVWGISTSQLSADWAAQRIQNFDLLKAGLNAIFKIDSGAKTIIKSFYYPKYGPGMLFNKLKQLLEKNNIKVHLNQEIISFGRSKTSVKNLTIKDKKTGRIKVYKVDHVISTMPLNKLVLYLNPDRNLKNMVKKLNFRNFITVNLIVKANPFPDQWIYIHDPQVTVGRIQNFRNWSPYMVKKGEKNTPIGMEYFCNEGDNFWETADRQLINQATGELTKIGLAKKSDIIEGFVYRVKNAYPVYNMDYKKPLLKAKEFIEQINNLATCGRAGLFRYNNQDHSILTGFYATRNYLFGKKKYDVWEVNEESGFLEEKK